MNIDKEERLFELLGEIESICIGADSPDALENGERDPVDELKKCRVDLETISNIVTEAKDTLYSLSEFSESNNIKESQYEI